MAVTSTPPSSNAATTSATSPSASTRSPITSAESGDPANAAQDVSASVGAIRTPLTETCRSVRGDRKSTRLNSSHSQISYAVFCLKKKKKQVFRGYEVRKETVAVYQG